MASSKQLALKVPNDLFDIIDDDFKSQGLLEWTMKSAEGEKCLTGRTINGVSVRIARYDNNGFSEKTASICRRLSPAKRKIEAKRLHKKGLTQNAISERLGCSQKTISNDINS